MPSRNAPCPCGSGKKWKKCCGAPASAVAPTDPRAAKAHNLDGDLVARMIKYARRRFGDEWCPEDEYPGDPDESPEEKQLFVPWSVYHCKVDDRPIVDWFLEERGGTLSETETRWLAAQRNAWLSLWEVTAAKPGVEVSVLDLLTGETRTVAEASGARSLVKRDIILGRVVDYGGVSVFCGVHPHPLPQRLAASLVRDALGELGVVGRSATVEGLKRIGADLDLIYLWEGAVEEAGAAGGAPELQNTDGDPLLLTTDTFAIAPEARGDVESRLSALDGTEREHEGDCLRVVFVRRGKNAATGQENTVVGSATVSRDMVELETNSLRRADDLRRRIEEACAGLVKHKNREQMGQDALREKAMAAGPAPDGLAIPGSDALVREFKEQHYAGWLSESIPALGGQTPREAARTPLGREMLEQLLRELENQEARLPMGERYDVSILRRELGLGG